MTEKKLYELESKVTELVSTNMEFVEALSTATDIASVTRVFNEYGIEVSETEVEQMHNVGQTLIKENSNAELDEADLENVAGGGFIRGTARLAASSVLGFGYGCVCGLCPAACGAAPYVVGGLTVWTTAGYLRK